jgi:outer membrane protein assembly factor BamB
MRVNPGILTTQGAMTMNSRRMVLVWGCLVGLIAGNAFAQDWPQWLGPHRDGKVEGFHTPKTWPKELKQQWKVAVGDGVATPALVGNKLYVFGREEGQEVIRCLNAATGEEIWQNKYDTDDAGGPAARFPVPGPRSSPAVAGGMVVTLGTRGILSCLDAETGKLAWRKQDYRSWPQFFVSSSPMIVDGLCIAQLGGERDGGIVAYDLATGEEKWKWTGDGPAYGSPVLATLGETKVIIAPTARNLVAVNAGTGKLLWEQPYSQGRYNAATPIVEGQSLIFAGPTRGITAKKLVQNQDAVLAEALWSNPDNSVMYNTPVYKNGLLFGLSSLNSLFCIDVKTGKTTWNASTDPKAAPPAQGNQQQGQSPRGRRGGGGSGGYGSVVDAGEVLLALPPSGDLIVFQAEGQAYKELARYKVADKDTYCYPILAGNRIFVKDKDSVTLWTLE